MRTLIIKDLQETNLIWGCVSYDDDIYSEHDIKAEISEIIDGLRNSSDETWQVNDLAREFNKRHCFKDACFATNVSCVRV